MPFTPRIQKSAFYACRIHPLYRCWVPTPLQTVTQICKSIITNHVEQIVERWSLRDRFWICFGLPKDVQNRPSGMLRWPWSFLFGFHKRLTFDLLSISNKFLKSSTTRNPYHRFVSLCGMSFLLCSQIVSYYLPCAPTNKSNVSQTLFKRPYIHGYQRKPSHKVQLGSRHNNQTYPVVIYNLQSNFLWLNTI